MTKCHLKYQLIGSKILCSYLQPYFTVLCCSASLILSAKLTLTLHQVKANQFPTPHPRVSGTWMDPMSAAGSLLLNLLSLCLPGLSWQVRKQVQQLRYILPVYLPCALVGQVPLIHPLLTVKHFSQTPPKSPESPPCVSPAMSDQSG